MYVVSYTLDSSNFKELVPEGLAWLITDPLDISKNLVIGIWTIPPRTRCFSFWYVPAVYPASNSALVGCSDDDKLL